MAGSLDEGKDVGPALSFDKDPKSSRTRTVGFLLSASKRLSAISLSSRGGGVDGNHVPSRQRATFGILADKNTDEVPGTILLLSQTRNEPLGYDQMEAHREDIDARSARRSRRSNIEPVVKKTPNGKIVLDPQPEDTPNDPLNWPAWRRDAALLSLGFYCMVGGGMTPILAAGFNQVAQTYSVTYSEVALTTGLYMMGLGVGSVIFSPTAILWGKRPVYLASSILFILAAVWCALAPSYPQLVVARIFQGVAVSPVECLPSATIAEIFFLHERAFRIGIYTLLLLGGKNLIPLVSAAIIQSLGWRWVFWIIAICVGFGGALLFLFVPETFWDRTPRPKKRRRTLSRSLSRSRLSLSSRMKESLRPGSIHRLKSHHEPKSQDVEAPEANPDPTGIIEKPKSAYIFDGTIPMKLPINTGDGSQNDPMVQQLHNLNSPYYAKLENAEDYFAQSHPPVEDKTVEPQTSPGLETSAILTPIEHDDRSPFDIASPLSPEVVKGGTGRVMRYTTGLREAPPQPWLKSLKVFNGRISSAKWWRVACRPFVLFAYPAVLWSSLVYALSVGWLIVLSESVAHIYATSDTYNFSAIQTGLVYLSPFIGGVMGTAVAGKASDIIVRYFARHNGGIYEPEFRLVMAIPITLTTAIGLMGFGWSAEERDNFMVPTVFFGIISFGCCVGSTTAITFCVDSYRQFAGEALVTLNFSKNILHGLIWSLFFPAWLQDDGPKTVFLAIGGIQIACILTTIPMYIYGKRARMWTVRKRMMERL